MPETDVPQTDDPETDDPETDVPETEGQDGHPRDGWHRRVAQTDGPGRKSLDGRVLRFHGFSSQGHPSVPLVLALPVSETDGAETDVPETEEGRPSRMSPRWRKATRDGCPRDGGRPPETDVAVLYFPEMEGVFFQALCQLLVNVTYSFFFSFGR